MPKRYILALLIIAVVFFGAIILLISLIGGRGSDNEQTETTTSQSVAKPKELSKDANSVTYTTYGRVVGEETRRAIRVTITNSERRVDVLQGYDENVIKSQTTANKQSAYEAFLIALQSAQFDLYDKNNKTDDRSQCTTGQRYVYEVRYSDNSSIRSWSTACSVKIGSFQGNKGQVQTLFHAQIPDYSKFVSGVNL